MPRPSIPTQGLQVWNPNMKCTNTHPTKSAIGLTESFSGLGTHLKRPTLLGIIRNLRRQWSDPCHSTWIVIMVILWLYMYGQHAAFLSKNISQYSLAHRWVICLCSLIREFMVCFSCSSRAQEKLYSQHSIPFFGYLDYHVFMEFHHRILWWS